MISERPFAFTSFVISTFAEELPAGFFDLKLGAPGLGFEFDVKKALTSGVGHIQAQKNLPSRIVVSTTRPTESHAAGTNVLLASVICRKPSGQVKAILKSSREQIVPHPSDVTAPNTMTSTRTEAVMRRSALTVIKFFFLFIVDLGSILTDIKVTHQT